MGTTSRAKFLNRCSAAGIGEHVSGNQHGGFLDAGKKGPPSRFPLALQVLLDQCDDGLGLIFARQFLQPRGEGRIAPVEFFDVAGKAANIAHVAGEGELVKALHFVLRRNGKRRIAAIYVVRNPDKLGGLAGLRA